MRVRDFLALEKVARVDGNPDQEVSGLAYDSRLVAAGNIFFAIPGEKADGHDYVQKAIERGASAIVVSREVPAGSPTVAIKVDDVRRVMGIWGAHFFAEPSRQVKLVGITGTNGKTTVSYLVEAVLTAAGLNPGVIGTINYRYGDRQLPSHHTTPESLELQSLIREMTRAGVRAVIMEVSSHALAQERVRGLAFDVAVFTNLSRDHLDYHRDMDDYFAAKAKLFTDHLAGSNKAVKAAVIFAGDPWGRTLLNLLRSRQLDCWSYGENDQCDVHPENVENDVNGLRGVIRARGRALEFSSILIGHANLQNILAATAVGCALGLADNTIVEGLQRLRSVPGRLEKVANDQGMTILVDYAHTPDALEKVLGALRPLTRGRLMTVFGCGGDRDRGKRPLMGEIAARLSDVVMLTSDNPRTEDPLAILDEIEVGVRQIGREKWSEASGQVETRGGHKGYWRDPDRRAAIRKILREAGSDDLVLIAGKGHEDYQIVGTQKSHFDDREVVSEELARLSAGVA